MSVSLGILFGIIAMIGWGFSDFFAAMAARKTSVIKTLVWSQIVGTLMLILAFLLFFKFPDISFNYLMLILISAFLNIIALLAFYKGMQIGNVSVISPISSAYAAITVILSLIFLNEKLTALQAAGISLAILGTILASFKLHGLMKLKLKNIVNGVRYGIIAMLGWGIAFVFIGILVENLGWFFPPLLVKTTGIFYILAYAGTAKKSISFPKNAALLVALIGILETIGFLSIGAGMSFEQTSIVVPVSSTYALMTVILAQIFFKEVIELNQKIGIIAVLLGLVLLSI